MADKKVVSICMLLLAISVLLITIGITGLVQLWAITDCVVIGNLGGGGGLDYSCTPIAFDGYGIVFGLGFAIGFIPASILIIELRDYLRNSKHHEIRRKPRHVKNPGFENGDIILYYGVRASIIDVDFSRKDSYLIQWDSDGIGWREESDLQPYHDRRARRSIRARKVKV